MNNNISTVIVAPMTTKGRSYPTRDRLSVSRKTRANYIRSN
ncbi:MAG: hypothetical protein WBA77_06880 [Microcoleaceae cyanobacterium]